MAEVCGDKDLMRAAGGQTVDKPCRGALGFEVYCNLPDVKDWQQRIGDLQHMMIETWNSLYDLEGEQPQRTHTAPGSPTRTSWDRIVARIEALPDVPWYGIGDQAAEAVAQMVGIVQDQACLIATMRKQITAAGGKPPPLPFTKPSARIDLERLMAEQANALRQQTPKIVNGVLIIGGLATLAYVLRPAIVKGIGARAARGTPTKAKP